MTASELKKKYLDFFLQKNHQLIPNVSLIPEHDPTVLFTTAGMHPLVPYLLGEPHSLGKRLVSVQRCLRTDDIDEVGDAVHHTFFEMLGNWSLGDPASSDGGQGGYWKKEAITWSFEFLTSKDWLGIDKERLAVSVFAGDDDALFDQESYDAWLSLGLSESRIAKLPKKNNWWGPAGQSGPCGPDTEMFVWAGPSASSGQVPQTFDPDDPHWFEVWNDVFMQYNKTAEGKFEPLAQKNVDTGMGVERVTAILQGKNDDYETELFLPIIKKIEEISGKKYEDYRKEFRVIADHLKAAIFLIKDGVIPSNKDRGYVLRRLLRRAAVKMYRLQESLVPGPAFSDMAKTVIQIYQGEHYDLNKDRSVIDSAINSEMEKFGASLDRGLREVKKITKIDGTIAFGLFQTYGFPLELTEELFEEKGQKIDREQFEKEFKKHQELSRTASAGMFKGGLADNSEQVTKYHTATHLLQAALREVLGPHVFQKGSNITAERLRFDFSHPERLTPEQQQKVEALVNQKIEENLSVTMEMMTPEEAKKKGALAVFEQRYGDQVKVFSIGDFSKEVCGGPHVDFTGKLGRFKIIKEEAAGAGVRRIYAALS